MELFNQISESRIIFQNVEQINKWLQISATTKLAVIWPIKERVLLLDIVMKFYLSYFSFLIVNFVHFELFFVMLYVLFQFFPWGSINLICILTILTFPVSKMGLSTLAVWLISIAETKLGEIRKIIKEV